MPILNLLSVIFHWFVCKFRGNLVSKLCLILYIELISFKQQFLIDHYWRTITKKILENICSIPIDLGYVHYLKQVNEEVSRHKFLFIYKYNFGNWGIENWDIGCSLLENIVINF